MDGSPKFFFSKEQGLRQPRHSDVPTKRRLVHLIQFHRRATVKQMAEKVNAGCDRKVMNDRCQCHVWFVCVAVELQSAQVEWSD